MSKKSPSRTNLIHTSEDESDSSLEASFDSSAVKVGNSSGKTQRKKRGNNNAPDGPRQDGPDLNVMDGELKNYLDLQEVLAEVRLADQLESPSIVVIGDQGAGKSTVLELLSQITLPRDTKIATRCPIHITMRKETFSQIDINYTIPKPDRTRADERSHVGLQPEEVQNYLRAAQEKMVREGEEVCSDPIQLRVCGPSVPDLAIVDLPGLTYVDKNVTREIKGMIQKWIEKPSTVIVVVFPCTGDIASTQAIQMARNVDPNFDRTMCVLTKPDLALERQVQLDVMQLASNKHEAVKFKRGFVLVRGKGADEIGATIAEARQREKEFFENHEMFRELYRTNKAGTETLIRIVSRIIHQIARRNLPLLVGEIRNMYRQAEAKKKSYPVIFEDDKSKYVELARIVDGITKDFSELTLEEKSSSECDEFNFQPNSLAYDQFSYSVLSALIPDGDLYSEMREEYIKHRGPEPRGFPRYSIYRNHVERKMRQIELIAMEALGKVETMVSTALGTVLKTHADRFSLLRPINDLTMGVFDTQRLACKQYLETFYLMESKPFINDYNLKNVPLSLTSDKRKYQLLPTILTEICDPLSGVVTKSKKKKILKRMRGLLGIANPGAKPKIDSFFENVTEQLAAAGGSTDSEDNQTDDEADSFDVGRDDESERVPFKLPGGPPTQAPYSSKPIQDYVDEAVQKTMEMYYKYTYHVCCSMLDSVPKIIEYHMVISLKEKLLRSLIENLNELAACMREDPVTATARAEANEQLAKLERVLARCRMFDNMGIGQN